MSTRARQRPRFLAAALALAIACLTLGAQEVDTVKFSHKQHIEDVGVECLDCHDHVSADTVGGARRLPPKETCETCHEDNIGSGDEEDCALCHTNVSEAEALIFTRQHTEFFHGPHLLSESDCLRCHATVPASESRKDAEKPAMDVCMSCHNDRRAPSDCYLCHLRMADLLPESHNQRWLAREGHGLQARFGTQECRTCHEDSYCDECHLGQLSTRIHNPNYRYTHSVEAKRIDRNCGVCHQVGNFCYTCH